MHKVWTYLDSFCQAAQTVPCLSSDLVQAEGLDTEHNLDWLSGQDRSRTI